MLLQHAAGSRHLPSCDRAHVACTWRSKVRVGSLESACPPLEASPLKVINAADDKKSFKSNKLYLRSNNNPKWLKLSYEAYYEGVDLHVKVNVRDYKNQILYQRKVVNVSWSRVLRDIANIYY